MSQGTKQQAVRLPVELHAKIVAAATENNRSGHAEMLHRLEQSFTESNGIVDMVRGDLNALEERLLKKLAPEMFITSVHIDASHMSEEDIDKMGAGFIAEELKPFYGAASPTGRLSKSQPEISGLNTLPQAMPKKRHSGGFVSQPAGEAPQILERGEHPSLRHLTTPGALEWDRPGEETSWRVHDGINPIGLCISADTIVEVERRDGVKLPADRAGDFGWKWDASLLPGKDPAEIYAWRLVPGQAEYPGGWIENTGHMPVQSKVSVEWRTRGGFGYKPEDIQGPQRAGRLKWTFAREPDAFDITHWRHAK